jgi:hypothetical protein
MNPEDLIAASERVALFQKGSLRAQVTALEAILSGKTIDSLIAILQNAGVAPELAAAAVQVKRAAAQINELSMPLGCCSAWKSC